VLGFGQMNSAIKRSCTKVEMNWLETLFIEDTFGPLNLKPLKDLLQIPLNKEAKKQLKRKKKVSK